MILGLYLNAASMWDIHKHQLHMVKSYVYLTIIYHSLQENFSTGIFHSKSRSKPLTNKFSNKTSICSSYKSSQTCCKKVIGNFLTPWCGRYRGGGSCATSNLKKSVQSNVDYLDISIIRTFLSSSQVFS